MSRSSVVTELVFKTHTMLEESFTGGDTSSTEDNCKIETTLCDNGLLDCNLSLTFEERLLNHQRALETINELIRARKQIYGEPKFSSESAP